MNQDPLFDDEDEIIDLAQEVEHLRAENRNLEDIAKAMTDLAINRDNALRLAIRELEKSEALLSAIRKIARDDGLIDPVISEARQARSTPATGWIPMGSADQASHYPNSPMLEFLGLRWVKVE